MPVDKKPEDQVTEAGAVELDETQLDDAAGGGTGFGTIAVSHEVIGGLEPPDPSRVAQKVRTD